MQGSEPTEADVDRMIRTAFSQQMLQQFLETKTEFLIAKSSLEFLVKLAHTATENNPGLRGKITSALATGPWNVANFAAMAHLGLMLKDTQQVGIQVTAEYAKKRPRSKGYRLQAVNKAPAEWLFVLCEGPA